MAGYIGSKSSVTLVDGYSEAEADAEFVTKTGDTMSGDLVVENSNGATINVNTGLAGAVSKVILHEGSTASPANGATLEYDGATNLFSIGVGSDISTKRLSIARDTGNVGLNLASPSEQLSTLGNVNIGNNDSSNPLSYLRFGATQYGAADIRPSDEGGHKVGLDFYTDGTGDVTINPTFAMRITGTGNVGIGTSSPATDGKLTIHGTDTDSGILLSRSSGNDVAVHNIGGTLAFRTGGESTTLGGLTERMRIDSSGNVLVGTTTTGFANDNGFTIEANSVVQRHANGVGSGTAYAWFTYNGGAIGSITQNGTTSVSYNTSSDYRLKESWVLMVGASERVLDLKPVNFAWKADGKRVDGFLAHELADVVPEAVTGTKDAMRDEEYEVTPAVEATYDEDGNELTAAVEAVMGTRSVPDYQGIDQSKLVPLLTAALQEALTEIASLKTRVEALEA